MVQKQMTGGETQDSSTAPAPQSEHRHAWIGQLCEFLVGLDFHLEQAGFQRQAAAGLDDESVAIELAELARDGVEKNGRPGISGNKDAQGIARVLDIYQGVAHVVLQRAGLWQGIFPGYVAGTFHMPDRIRGLDSFDLARGMFPPEAEARKRWLEFMLAHADLVQTFGGAEEARAELLASWNSMANRCAIHETPLEGFVRWRSPADWAEYNRAYGAGTPVAAVIAQLYESIRRVADADNELPTDVVGAGAFLATIHWSDFDSTSTAPVDRLAGKLATLRDPSGSPFLARWRDYLAETLAVAERTGEREQTVELVKAGLDALLIRLVLPYAWRSTVPGEAVQAIHLMFKYTGRIPANDHQRAVASAVIARAVGLRKAQDFEMLPPALQEAVGDVATWRMLQKADWAPIEGAPQLFCPELRHRLDVPFEESNPLEHRMTRYICDVGIAEALDPVARARALRPEPGFAVTNALRLVLRIESCVTAMLAQSWDRLIFGGGARIGVYAGVAEPAIGGLIAGYAALCLREDKLLDPGSPQTIARALTAGIGIPVYGDMLFGALARYNAIAPERLRELRAQWEKDEAGRVDAFTALTRAIAAENVWMTQEAIDLVLVHTAQEAMTPNYLARVSQKLAGADSRGWLLGSKSIADADALR